MLHFEFKNAKENVPNSSSNSSGSLSSPAKSKSVVNQNSEVKKIEDTSVSCLVSKDEKIVVLPSAVVSFECEYRFRKYRVLLVSCSQVTLFSDKFVRKFGLPVNAARNAPCIKGVGIGAWTIPVKATTKLDQMCLRLMQFGWAVSGASSQSQ